MSKMGYRKRSLGKHPELLVRAGRFELYKGGLDWCRKAFL
jgi:hypothetical protein